MVIKSIHKKYGGRKQIESEEPSYMTPNIYISYIKFIDKQITLDESTLEKYKKLMKMSCEQIDLGFGDSPERTNNIMRTIYKVNGQPVLRCECNMNSGKLKYFINNKYIKWNNITVKAGSNAELMYAVQLDTGEVIFVLFTIKARFAEKEFN